MMKIVISRTDGGVSVMTVVAEADIDECIAKWSLQNDGEYLSHREMPDEAIPSDRTFRDAWADVTPAAVIDIDMEKARGIHLGRIREKRNAELARLDIDAIKAQDTGDSAALSSIRARKQALRDLPQVLAPSIESASTVEDLILVGE
jgi:hypothetical protein